MSTPDDPGASHARASDLPGWPCPPRVRDIPQHGDSWGWVAVATFGGSVAQDELGYLWADGAAVPRFKTPDPTSESPGAVLVWTERGLGVWVHPKSFVCLPNVSRLDMEPDRWVPIAVVLPELPPSVKAGPS
jgi:hypothetical protein